jgi:HK97 family phage portal protein
VLVYPGDQPAAHGEPLENHRLRRLISQPNPVTGEFEFFELSVTYLDLAGNCYWLIQRGRDGLPAELWPVRPDLIRIFPTRNPRVWSYGYILDPTAGNPRDITTAIIPIDARDMIHVKYANPLNAYFGQAPLRPAARAVSLDNAATDFVDSLLRNYAVPGVVIKTATEVTQVIADKLKRKWKAAFTGARRGEPAVLQAGMDVQPLGMTLRDLEFPDLRAITESRICAAFQVPPILVGAKVGLDRSTFTNYQEARKQLWEEAIFSLQRRFRDPVETQLLPEFSGTGRARVTVRCGQQPGAGLRGGGVGEVGAGGERPRAWRDHGERFPPSSGLDTRRGGDVSCCPRGSVPLPMGALPQAGDVIGAQPPGEQPGLAPPAPPTPQVRVASYADEFLASLGRKRLQHVNGHGR